MGKGKKNKGGKQNKGGKNHRPSHSVDDEGSTHHNHPVGKRSRRKKHHLSNNNDTPEDALLRESIEADGKLVIIEMEADGNCLFRSISDQLFYDHGQRHFDVRQEICDYLQGHESFFSLFLDLDDEETKGEDAADFAEYIADMRGDGEWGGNLELVAAARLYQRRIRVFSSNLAAMNIDYDSSDPPYGPELLVSYHDNDHYNSVAMATRSGKPPPSRKTYQTTVDDNRQECDERATEGTESPSTSGIDDVSDPTENAIIQSDEDGECVEVTLSNNTQSESRRKTKTTIKANAPCPCGSHLKYKKCCKGKDRREAVQRRRGMEKSSAGDLDRHDSSPGDKVIDEEAADQPTMEGKFRVLTI